MKRPHFALPEIYDDSLSYYDVLRKLIKSMHAIVDNLNKIPEQIANEAKARLLGDQGLQTNIDNEVQAREQADQEIREGVHNKISEIKSDLSKLSNEKIDNPSTGSVGQILEIESVDEKGKPKTYKAVDKPTSSGEVSYEQISSAVSEYMANNPIEESDPTVPEWAKSPQKPTYTAHEVGALPDTTKIPSKTSDLQNDSGFLTESQVNNLIDAKLTGVETLLGGGF